MQNYDPKRDEEPFISLLMPHGKSSELFTGWAVGSCENWIGIEIRCTIRTRTTVTSYNCITIRSWFERVICIEISESETLIVYDVSCILRIE